MIPFTYGYYSNVIRITKWSIQSKVVRPNIWQIIKQRIIGLNGLLTESLSHVR